MKTKTHKVSDATDMFGAPPSIPICRRPMRALLLQSLNEQPSAFGHVLRRENAATSVYVIQQGLTAIGHLLAHSSTSIEEGSIPSECVECLGRLMAELSDFSAECFAIATSAPEAGEPPAREGG